MPKIKYSHHYQMRRIEDPGHRITHQDLEFMIYYYDTQEIGKNDRLLFTKNILYHASSNMSSKCLRPHIAVVSCAASAGNSIFWIVSAHPL